MKFLRIALFHRNFEGNLARSPTSWKISFVSRASSAAVADARAQLRSATGHSTAPLARARRQRSSGSAADLARACWRRRSSQEGAMVGGWGGRRVLWDDGLFGPRRAARWPVFHLPRGRRRSSSPPRPYSTAGARRGKGRHARSELDEAATG
jgi:hypothetical protein